MDGGYDYVYGVGCIIFTPWAWCVITRVERPGIRGGGVMRVQSCLTFAIFLELGT